MATMSVLLDGVADIFESKPVWRGYWNFTKEHKTNLAFMYSWVSDVVPRDMLEYLSFTCRANSRKLSSDHSRGSSRGGSRGRACGRGRGRPPAMHLVDKADIFPSLVVASGSSDISMNDIESRKTSLDSCNVCQIDTEVTNCSYDKYCSDDNRPYSVHENNLTGEQSIDNINYTSLNSIANNELTFVPITRLHPLFGFWEGKFEVRPGVDDDAIHESFFFHSFIGFEPPSTDFADLPPEPVISYPVLGVTEAIVMPLVPKLQANKPAMTTADLTSSYQQDKQVLEDGGISQNSINKSSSSCEKCLSDIDPPADVMMDSCKYISSTELQNHLQFLATNDYVLLFGFGKNAIGRFSLICSFHQPTGTLKCEKKYIITKCLKRPRRYSWETPIALSRLNVLDTAMIQSPRLSSRPRNQFNSYPMFNEDLPISHHVPTKKSLSLPVAVAPISTLVSCLTGDVTEYNEHLKRIKKCDKNKEKLAADTSKVNREKLEYELEDSVNYRSAFLDETNGEVYEGSWSFGYRHGRGICLYSDGTMYEGNWHYGKEHGRGQLLTGDRQSIYTGEFLDGTIYGNGTYHFSNGEVYVGDWKEGGRHGKGEHTYKNGCKYIGDWKDNKRVGKGLFCWPDGSFYDGDWESDCRHGRGLLVLESGFRYDGSWIQNLMDGRGINVFPSGSEYQGTFRQGLREGRGSIKFKEGAEYEGRFKDDRIDGQGTVKITAIVPGPEEGEIMIPIQIQSDLKRIHLRAGFGDEPH